MAAVNVLGVFAHVDTTLDAIRKLREKGFSELTVYSPVPVEEIEHEVERVRPLSRERLDGDPVQLNVLPHGEIGNAARVAACEVGNSS